MKKREKSSWVISYACVLAILCTFVIGSLVLINIGVHVYKNIVENNGENFHLRASLSYVATKVRQCDQEDCISVIEQEGIPILVLKENLKSGTYRTMIYCYEGKLRELFQEESMEYKLADGLEVMELNAFGIEQVSDDKLKFTSFDGEESQSLTMFLRSM